MSGEVVIVVPIESVMPRAVAKLDELGRTLPPYALVGGLAVTIRLGIAHRTTLDLDAVSDDQQQQRR